MVIREANYCRFTDQVQVRKRKLDLFAEEDAEYMIAVSVQISPSYCSFLNFTSYYASATSKEGEGHSLA